MDCNQRCVCDFVNGTARRNCSSLCTTPTGPICEPESQEELIFQRTLRGSNCSCPAKTCIPG